MTTTGNPTEPSMEDILASIRKIIADEPADVRKPPPAPQGHGQPAPFSMKDIARNPAASSTDGTGPGLAAPGIQLPTSRDALAGHAPSRPAEVPFGVAAEPTAPAAPFEPNRARAAAIDEDLADLIEAAPSDADGALGKTRAEVSPVDAARQKWANLINPASAPPAPARVTDGPVGTTAAPSRPAPAAAPAVPATAPSPTLPAPSSSAAAPASGLFMPRKTGFYPPSGYNSAPNPAPETPAPVPAPALAAITEQPLADIDAPVSAGMPSPPPADLETAELKVEVSPPVEPIMAAEAALDALAAGLAKSSGESSAEDVPTHGAAMTTPLVASTPREASFAGARPLETRSPEAQPVRTLEDVVVDMMRPMLEKWLAENMPRIVERALKLDATVPGKPGATRSGG